MKNLPLLEPINTCCIQAYLKQQELDVCNDDICVDELRKQYPSAILDVFEFQLSQDSPELNQLDSTYFTLINEEKYLHFIEKAFYANNEYCIAKTGILHGDYEGILRDIDELDALDKHLFLHQVIHLWPREYEHFVFNNINLLKMLMRGIVRGYFHAEIYFQKKPMILFSNFDLSLPVIFKDELAMNFYHNLAKESNLYLR